MKRRSISLFAALAIVAVLPAPAGAHKGHARPRITRFEFVDRPLKAGTPERLIVVAHDPNSWISEIQVQWEDPTQSGGVIFAHTYCLQDPEFKNPGTPAKLKLDLEFDHAATYHLQARAISEKRCEGGNDTLLSRTLERELVVEDPTETFADPDDSAGPLDVVLASHSQGRDEVTYRRHLRHSLAFAETLPEPALTGAADDIRFLFDTDDVLSTFERTLIVDAGSDGTLQAEMHDASGTVVGEAAVTTDGSTLSVDFAKSLLGRGIDRYRWSVVTQDGTSDPCVQTQCQDRAPDAQLFEHQL